jgi:hypothetical protein
MAICVMLGVVDLMGSEEKSTCKKQKKKK